MADVPTHPTVFPSGLASTIPAIDNGPAYTSQYFRRLKMVSISCCVTGEDYRSTGHSSSARGRSSGAVISVVISAIY